MGHIRIRFIFPVYQCLCSPLLPPINCMLYVIVRDSAILLEILSGYGLKSSYIYALLLVRLLFHSGLFVFLSLHIRCFDICADLLRFFLHYLPMATWFTVIGRVAQSRALQIRLIKMPSSNLRRAIQNFHRAAASMPPSGATFSKAAGTM